MKNCYYWYSDRGFANEGTIFVTEQYRSKDLELKLQEMVDKDPSTSASWLRITRKQAESDKDFLATGERWAEDNTFAARLHLAEIVTAELIDKSIEARQGLNRRNV